MLSEIVTLWEQCSIWLGQHAVLPILNFLHITKYTDTLMRAEIISPFFRDNGMKMLFHLLKNVFKFRSHNAYVSRLNPQQDLLTFPLEKVQS